MPLCRTQERWFTGRSGRLRGQDTPADFTNAPAHASAVLAVNVKPLTRSLRER